MKSNLPPDLIKFLDSIEVKSFLNSASCFVLLLENKEITIEKFVRESHFALVDLYSKGIKLPEIELIYSVEKDYDRDELFKNNYAGKINDLGKEAFYWEVFDPSYSEEDKEPVQGWLADDFSDIYKDLKIELTKIDLGTNESVEDALWSLKWGFDNHWGNHCINALRAMHYLWYEGKNKN